jgi:hypothetical protein
MQHAFPQSYRRVLSLRCGYKSLSGNSSVCGDLQLSANTTINATSGAVVVLRNGRLDLKGYTLQTAAGSGLTLIFADSNSPSYQHIITGGGTLDIAAPTSGVWSGVSLFQAPNLTTNVDITYTGNSPTWNITGLVYLPNAAVTMKGAIGKATNGYACFTIVSESLLVGGTGSIFSGNTECKLAGLTPPTDDDGDVRLTE